jgi:hypothetical protein
MATPAPPWSGITRTVIHGLTFDDSRAIVPDRGATCYGDAGTASFPGVTRTAFHGLTFHNSRFGPHQRGSIDYRSGK